MFAGVCSAGQHGCSLPAAHVIHSDGAVVHAHPQHVGVALGEVQAGDTCMQAAGGDNTPSDTPRQRSALLKLLISMEKTSQYGSSSILHQVPP